jgi:glutathione synthase/RimK-type ligase-like ATP-grasp enzyme
MKNARRQIAQYLRRFADQNGIALTAMADDWIFVLERGAVRHIVVGYDLGLNPSTAHRVANDKAATCEVLTAAGVPALPHIAFLHPRFAEHLSFDGNWSRMLTAFEAWHRDVVVKPNEGTGGLSVRRVRTNFALEHAVHDILGFERSVAMSPFVEIDQEVRVFVLNGEALLAYEKNVLAVTGDGTATVTQLMAAHVSADTAATVLADQGDMRLDFGRIPAAGEEVKLHWKHNLGQGARHRLLALTDNQGAVALAARAATGIGLRFATVDIVWSDGKPMVLEINSGVMMESIARQQANGEELLDRIYGAALRQIFPQPARSDIRTR